MSIERTLQLDKKWTPGITEVLRKLNFITRYDQTRMSDHRSSSWWKVFLRTFPGAKILCTTFKRNFTYLLLFQHHTRLNSRNCDSRIKPNIELIDKFTYSSHFEPNESWIRPEMATFSKIGRWNLCKCSDSRFLRKLHLHSSRHKCKASNH